MVNLRVRPHQRDRQWFGSVKGRRRVITAVILRSVLGQGSGGRRPWIGAEGTPELVSGRIQRRFSMARMRVMSRCCLGAEVSLYQPSLESLTRTSTVKAWEWRQGEPAGGEGSGCHFCVMRGRRC
jgi:hypothetical protein